MYTIQANPSGTRNLEISEENLATIEKYGLFRHLIDSNGNRGRNRARQTQTEYPFPHRRPGRGQQRPARPLHRCYLPQQYESLRITAAYQALPAMAFPTNNHRRGRK